MSGEKENKLMSLIMNGRKSANTNTESSEARTEDRQAQPEDDAMARVEEELRAMREQLEDEYEGLELTILEKLERIDASLEALRAPAGEPV